MADRILLIDDDSTIRLVATQTLEASGYEVIGVDNGADGILRARATLPDLVLVDIYMDGLDGVAVARELAADMRTQDIPVVVLTASDEPDVMARAFAAGAVDYVTKGVDARALTMRIAARIAAARTMRQIRERARIDSALHRMNIILLEAPSDELGSNVVDAVRPLLRALHTDNLAVVDHAPRSRRRTEVVADTAGTGGAAPYIELVDQVDDGVPAADHTVRVDDRHGLRAGDAALAAAMELRNCESLLIFPLADGAASAGYIVVERASARAWSDTEIDGVRQASRSLATVIARRKAEQQLTAARQNFVQLVNNIKHALLLVTPQHERIIFSSPGAQAIFGSKATASGSPWSSIMARIHLHDHARLQHVLEHPSSGDQSNYVEIRAMSDSESPSPRWLAVRSFTVEDDVEPRIAVVMDDVTERKLIELRLIESRERELETSARIQRSILMENPHPGTDDVSVASLTIPSQEVDGDFYEGLKFTRNTFDLMIADVMGKGITGAFWGAALKSEYMRVAAEHLIDHPAICPAIDDIVNRVHERLTPSLIELNSFTTMVYCRFAFDRRQFEYVDCGHTPIIHFHARTDRCWLLKGSNPPLGFLEDEVYRSNSVPFSDDDVFFFYSDGIVEAQNPSGDLFGERRLVSLIESEVTQGVAPGALVDLVKEEVIRFTTGMGLQDDLTAIVVRCEPVVDDPIVKFDYTAAVGLETVPAIREQITNAVAERYGERLDERACAGVGLAMTEALNNIAMHGTRTDSASSVFVELGMRDTWFYLRVTYPGDTFDWTQVPVPDITRLDEHGYGNFVMHQLMDSVTFAHDLRGGMMLTMVRNVPTSGV